MVLDEPKRIISVYIINSISVLQLCSIKEIHIEIPKILYEEYIKMESEIEKRIFFNKVCRMISDCFNQLIEMKHKPEDLACTVTSYLQSHAE